MRSVLNLTRRKSLYHLRINMHICAQRYFHMISAGVALRKIHDARDLSKYEAIAISINSCTGDQYQVRKLVEAVDELSKKNL